MEELKITHLHYKYSMHHCEGAVDHYWGWESVLDSISMISVTSINAYVLYWRHAPLHYVATGDMVEFCLISSNQMTKYTVYEPVTQKA